MVQSNTAPKSVHRKLVLAMNLLGILCLLGFGMAKLHQAYAGESALDEVNARLSQAGETAAAAKTNDSSKPADTGAGQQTSATTDSPDMSDWSPARKKGFEEHLTSAPLGKLSIVDIKMEAALFEGDSELHLNKGVARVTTSAALGEPGNLVIAGHRDSFFRKLGQLKEGDLIQVTAINGQQHTYQMTDSWIVTPQDTWVMAPVSSDVLTLITCYPFYFVGSAPQRYIVRAKKISPNQQ